MKIEINFKNESNISVKEYETLAYDCLNEAMKDLNLTGPYEISYIFVNDEKMQEINRNYRNVDKVTDVITFDTGEEEYLADCFIAPNFAIKLAKENDLTMENEMAYLFVHSFLHSLGYDHEEDAVRCEMFDIQERIVEKVCKN